jgi:hypothetical protein
LSGLGSISARISVEDMAYVEDLVPLGYQKLRITRILHVIWGMPRAWPAVRES